MQYFNAVTKEMCIQTHKIKIQYYHTVFWVNSAILFTQKKYCILEHKTYQPMIHKETFIAAVFMHFILPLCVTFAHVKKTTFYVHLKVYTVIQIIILLCPSRTSVALIYLVFFSNSSDADRHYRTEHGMLCDDVTLWPALVMPKSMSILMLWNPVTHWSPPLLSLFLSLHHTFICFKSIDMCLLVYWLIDSLIFRLGGYFWLQPIDFNPLPCNNKIFFLPHR